MGEEPTTESGAREALGKPLETRATALDLAGGVLGLIVFLAGVALVIVTYYQARDWYREIGPAIKQARAEWSPTPARGSHDPGEKGKAAPPGPVSAKPGGTPLADVAAEFGLKLVWLILMAFIGFLVAALGARLAGAHRGKRT
ncbi:MAG: hypothetical protein FJX75_01800 [Armatimonadetes bacterium]|nr:hypothetical protein [Armatimonadota bacterium]